MKSAIVFACFVTYACAACTELNAIILQQQWGKCFGPRMKDKLDFGRTIVNSLFHQQPELKPLFERFNVEDMESPEFMSHVQFALGGVDRCIALIQKPDVLALEIAKLRALHIPLGLRDFNYQAVVRAIEHGAQACGQCSAGTVWSDCLHVVVDQMPK